LFYSTVASLEHSLNEAQKAYDELKATTEKEQIQALEREAQVARLTTELESLHENLHIKVMLFISSAVYFR